MPLTYEQFRYAPTVASEAKELYNTYAVPAAGVPLFQAATANLNPWTEVKVKSKAPDRGPMLIISGEKDHTVPWADRESSYKQQKRNEAVTEITEMQGRGHALTIDNGWRDGRPTPRSASCSASPRHVDARYPRLGFARVGSPCGTSSGPSSYAHSAPRPRNSVVSSTKQS